MAQRQRRPRGRKASGKRSPERKEPALDSNPAQREADVERARQALIDEALPGIEDFRAYMAEQNRRLEVEAFLDHIEGPQIMIHISRQDGRITATLIAGITPEGVRPSWDVRSTGRFNTRWTENVRGGLDALTREYVTRKLTEFYLTDFS